MLVGTLVVLVPFALRWDTDRPDASGTTSIGLAYTANFVLGPNAGANEFERVAGSSKSTGKFLTVNGTLSIGSSLAYFTGFYLAGRMVFNTGSTFNMSTNVAFANYGADRSDLVHFAPD